MRRPDDVKNSSRETVTINAREGPTTVESRNLVGYRSGQLLVQQRRDESHTLQRAVFKPGARVLGAFRVLP